MEVKTKNKPLIRALILDMDGVLWRQSQPIGDLPYIFNQIKKKGWKVALVTNNATLTIQQYLEKLREFGVELQAHQIINSPQAVSHYMLQHFPPESKVYIIGEDGLREELIKHGYQIAEKNVAAVIVGMDRELTYEKLCRATLNLRSGATFIATNGDRTFPTPEGLVPGVGAVLALLETASDQKPIILGKPEPLLYEIAIEHMQSNPMETLVVGDRLETDIQGAQKIGLPCAVVLSGVSTISDIDRWQPKPDYIFKDLQELVDELDPHHE
ncbi:MAG: HAD-IIA family hydrolase [Anaerolineales bacterium]